MKPVFLYPRNSVGMPGCSFAGAVLIVHNASVFSARSFFYIETNINQIYEPETFFLNWEVGS